MKHGYILFFLLFTSLSLQSQFSQPASTIKEKPDFSSGSYRAPGDSCSAYFNDYIAIQKTSLLFVEPMREGNATESGHYAGRAQRFNAPQEIEISGVRFYGYETNPLIDSALVLVRLYDWDETIDTVGALLHEDTAWVNHTAFTVSMADAWIDCIFDVTIPVSADYMVAIVSPDDDSVFIYTNSASSSDGAGEAVSYLYYDNPSYPTFTGWYNSLALFGATYDLDYLIAPRVSYDLHDSFNILDDTICPEVVSAGCITYAAKPVFSDPHYNSNFASPNSEIVFLWGDFTQNTGLTSACHTYDTPGVYNINVVDLLSRHNFGASDCPVDITQSIYVLDTVAANFTFVETGLNVDFTDLSTNHDSVWWDFGDATGSAVNNPSHAYATVGSFDVWLHVYNECFEDSIMMTVVTNDLGLENSEFKFNMFPNPASQTLILEGTIAGATVTISNVLGQTVYTAGVTGSKEVIPVSSFSSGAYFVNVSGSNGVSTKKLVVQH